MKQIGRTMFFRDGLLELAVNNYSLQKKLQAKNHTYRSKLQDEMRILENHEPWTPEPVILVGALANAELYYIYSVTAIDWTETIYKFALLQYDSEDSFHNNSNNMTDKEKGRQTNHPFFLLPIADTYHKPIPN